MLPQNAPQRNCLGHLALSDDGVSTLAGPAWLSALCKGLSPQVSNPGPGSADSIWGNPLQAVYSQYHSYSIFKMEMKTPSVEHSETNSEKMPNKH